MVKSKIKRKRRRRKKKDNNNNNDDDRDDYDHNSYENTDNRSTLQNSLLFNGTTLCAFPQNLKTLDDNNSTEELNLALELNINNNDQRAGISRRSGCQKQWRRTSTCVRGGQSFRQPTRLT